MSVGEAVATLSSLVLELELEVELELRAEVLEGAELVVDSSSSRGSSSAYPLFRSSPE